MKNLLFFLALCCYSTAFSQVVIKSFAKSSVSEKGLFGQTSKLKETVITSVNKVDDYKISLKNNIAKFAIPKSVNIYPLKEALKEVINNEIIYRQKIVGIEATTMKISFDVLVLSKNAQLYIYNPEGTVITGPITIKDNINRNDRRLWSSNSFQGNSVILELKIPKHEIEENEVHISQVLMGYPKKMSENPIDSVAFGYFNTSSSCNINVLCSQGNAWVNERKGVCLIETNDGGVGSGALITNTCNLNKP